MPTFTLRGSIANDTDDCHLSVQCYVHSTAGVAVTRTPRSARNAYVRGVEVAIDGVVNIYTMLVADDWEIDEA